MLYILTQNKNLILNIILNSVSEVAAGYAGVETTVILVAYN